MIESFDKDIYYKNGEYIIKEIVCDYEIIDLRNNEEPAMILNCFHNAKLVCDILKADELQEHFKIEHKPIEIAQMKYLEKELALYKKALELACENFEENDKAYLTKNKQKSKENHKKHFLQKAKEEIDEQKRIKKDE